MWFLQNQKQCTTTNSILLSCSNLHSELYSASTDLVLQSVYCSTVYSSAVLCIYSLPTDATTCFYTHFLDRTWRPTCTPPGFLLSLESGDRLTTDRTQYPLLSTPMTSTLSHPNYFPESLLNLAINITKSRSLTSRSRALKIRLTLCYVWITWTTRVYLLNHWLQSMTVYLSLITSYDLFVWPLLSYDAYDAVCCARWQNNY